MANNLFFEVFDIDIRQNELAFYKFEASFIAFIQVNSPYKRLEKIARNVITQLLGGEFRTQKTEQL